MSEIRIPIDADADIVTARQRGRQLAADLGFTSIQLTLIATAISELARNILLYAKHGEIILRTVQNSDKPGIVVVARDEGPGIFDLKQALQVGYSTSGSLGLGLPGVRRLMSEFEIQSEQGKGTTVTVKKWK
ncbi:MAG TPA: anti-sigma regulatory factor [Gammaproteobacteria bacterium]